MVVGHFYLTDNPGSRVWDMRVDDLWGCGRWIGMGNSRLASTSRTRLYQSSMTFTVLPNCWNAPDGNAGYLHRPISLGCLNHFDPDKPPCLLSAAFPGGTFPNCQYCPDRCQHSVVYLVILCESTFYACQAIRALLTAVQGNNILVLLEDDRSA